MKKIIRTFLSDENCELVDGTPLSILPDAIPDGTRLGVLTETPGGNDLGEFLTLQVAVEQKGVPWEVCKRMVIRQWTKRIPGQFCGQCPERLKGGQYCKIIGENVPYDQPACEWHKKMQAEIERIRKG